MIKYGFIVAYHNAGAIHCYIFFLINPVFHKNQIIKFTIWYLQQVTWPKLTLQSKTYIPTLKAEYLTCLQHTPYQLHC